MKTKDKDEYIMFEDALQMPELAHLHDVILYVENAHDSELSPKKYQIGLEHIASKKIQILYKENPEMGIKHVIMAVFEKLPDDMPTLFIVKITQFILKKWETVSNSIPRKENKTELV